MKTENKYKKLVLVDLNLRLFTRSRPFVRIWFVARVRKKYGCFAVYTKQN